MFVKSVVVLISLIYFLSSALSLACELRNFGGPWSASSPHSSEISLESALILPDVAAGGGNSCCLLACRRDWTVG